MKKKTKDNKQNKLILYRITSILFYILCFFSTFVVGIMSPVDNWIGWMIFSLSIIFFVLAIIFFALLDNQKKKTMHNSIEYYKQKMPFIGIQILIIFICLLFATIMNAENKNVDFDILFNLNISLTSLNFVVLTFIVPHMKERISQLMKNVKRQKVEVKGRIYNTIQKYNQSYIVVFTSIILVFIYIFTTIFSDTATQHFYLLLSLLYNSYVLIKLIISIKTIFWINLKDVEDKLEDKNNEEQKTA